MRRVLRIAGRASGLRRRRFSGLAAFEARCTDCKRRIDAPRTAPSRAGRRGLLSGGTCSHDALHHRDEPLLLRLAQVRHGVAVRGARRRLHLAQQACACPGQPANLRPAIPAVNGALDKLARLQALKRAGGCGAIEGHVSRKCRLISSSTPGQSGKQTILQRGDLEGSAFLLEERDMDLMQPPDQKSRPLPQRPGIAALVHCVVGHPTTLSLPMLHEFDAIYGMIVVV
jgi:hypothetical protein